MNVGADLIDGARAAVGVSAAGYALAGQGLNLQFGYAGLMNFGQTGFLLVGAYGTAISVDKLHWPLPVAFGFGVVCAIALGLVLGLPTLRLRADYLAITTISAAEILRIVAHSRAATRLTGGPFGIRDFAGTFFDWNPYGKGRYGWVGHSFSFDERAWWVMTVGWGLVAACSIVVALLVHSPWGRMLRAIREDEAAVRSLGKNVFAVKLQTLVVGGVLGALAGILITIDAQFVNDAYFLSTFTFFIFTATILGGIARIWGPIFGSMLFWFLLQSTDSLLRDMVSDNVLGLHRVLQPVDVGPITRGFVGISLVLLMVFRPQGAFGDRHEVMIGDS